MKSTYQRYRSYGHSRFVAATWAINPWLFYGAFAVIGVFFGWLL